MGRDRTLRQRGRIFREIGTVAMDAADPARKKS
jgi:hypothetical protein